LTTWTQDFQSSVEDAKASGLVARAIEKTGARGVSVAAPAKQAPLILPSP
jgi:hypothetical protein